MFFFEHFSAFRFLFQPTAILHTTMQFSIFHTYREIVGLAQSYPLFGAEFLFVLAPGAVFLPNDWLGSNASVTREVKSPTRRLAPHEALRP